MTVECKIGPIELDTAQLVDGDTNERTQELQKYLTPGKRLISQGLSDKSEGFGIYCKKYKALQIAGLARWKELEWIDSSTSLINNDDITHRGWGVLGKTELLNYPGPYCDMALEVDIISPNENHTFLMDYVNGAFSQLLVGYDEDAKEYLVQDPFDTFSDQIWTDPVSYRISSPVVTTSSGSLYLQGIKSSGNYGALFTRLEQILPSQFTLETGVDLNVSYTPATTSAIYLSTVITTQAEWNDFFSSGGSYSEWVDAIVISVGITYSGGAKVYTVYVYQFDENGVEKSLINPFSTTGAVHNIKVDLKDDGNIEIFYDDVKKYSGPSGLSSVNEGLYAGYVLDISDTATPSATYFMKATYMNVYTDRTFPQQVILPPLSRTFEPPTCYRQSLYGNLPVFENPTSGVQFQTSSDDYYKGGPILWSSENEKGQKRQVFNPDEVLDPATFELENGLIQISIDQDKVKLYYYDPLNEEGGYWTLLEDIELNTVPDLVKIEEINREVVTLRINRTSWTMRRGDPVLKVEHPYDDLGISLVTCYQHDGTLTTNPKAGDNITMNTQHYLLKWEAGPNMMGTYKWAHSVLGNDGKIYGIPDRAQDILIVDPATGTATRDTMGANIPETIGDLWLGGVKANNGKIYCIPFDATSILIIDPSAGTATTSTMGASLTGSAKWYGGVLGDDGKIYGIPYDATDILIIDPSAGTATRSTMGATLTGSAKWAGGAKGYAGRIYAAPNNATDVLIIDVSGGTASRNNLGLDLSGNYKYIGAVRAPSTRDIFCIPNNSTKVLIIVNGPNIGTFMSGSALTGNDKWANGAVGSDGKIYAFPSSAEDILIINPAGTPSATRSNMGCTDLVEVYKWFSGCPGSDGKIYGIPEDVDDFLIINPAAGTATRDKLNTGSCDDPLNPQQKRLMIVQTSPTTIKSDTIPATAYTGLGIYDKDEAPNGPSGYITLAGCFVNRGRQKMKLL